MKRYLPLCLFAALLAVRAFSSDLDEFKVKRESVFEFTKKPVISSSGYDVKIAFETRSLCDVTVAIEEASGKIVRHLASGVLGPNAPEPFTKNSLKQELIWDSKDDQDAYVAKRGSLIVRVSLGLKPQFERSLNHSPYKRFGRNQPIFIPAPEGVYVFDGDIVDSVRLFGHDGTYIRTVYPFPSGKLEQVKGLRWHEAPQDGARLPLKEGYHQATFFDSGYNGGHDANNGYGLNRYLTLKHFDGAPVYAGASAAAVHGQRLVLAGISMIRMATDGSSGGLELNGPRTSFPALSTHYCAGQTPIDAVPREAALSPDEKWLYLTGFTWDEGGSTAGNAQRWIHGLARVAVGGAGQDKAEMLVGTAKWDASGAGNAADKLNSPMSVACDAQGRIFVADYGNNRVQVFSPDGKLQESIPSNRPVHIALHQKTGEIYVFSWAMHCDVVDGKQETINATVSRLEAGSGHKKIAEYPLPFAGYRPIPSRAYGPTPGMQYRIELDSWAESPTVWLISGPTIALYALDKDKLVLKRDLSADAKKATADLVPGGNSRQRLTVNPQTGRLYVQEARESERILEIDPATGIERYVEMPFQAEDICFDFSGCCYLRTGSTVVRYDPSVTPWREVPWDYGEEQDGIAHCGGRTAKADGALITPGKRASPWYHGGGIGVSPKGHLAVQCWNAAAEDPKMDRPGEPKDPMNIGKPYTPRIFPGRQRWGEIHLWDQHGKVLCDDAIPGITITDGIAVDKDDCIYVLTNPTRTPGGKNVLNPKTETLIKFKAGKGKVITSGTGLAVSVAPDRQPDGPTQMSGYYQAPAWATGAEWLYGGVGYAGGRCTCWNARFALDYYSRSFVPEPDHFSVAILDTAGNVILRVGRPGNVEDGKPLVADPAVPESRSIGGDETAIMHACYVGVDSDRRLFISDAGNRRIASVRLGYSAEEKVPAPE